MPPISVANEQEFERFSIDAQISEQALREIYLRPFEMVVRSSAPKCLMTSYNSINGYHADMSSRLLQEILRQEWGFSGLVMSDWGGTNSTVESLLAGLDLEMAGPPEHRGDKLVQALSDCSDEEATAIKVAIDKSAMKMLSLAQQHGLLGLSPEDARKTRDSPESSSTTNEDIRLIREIAASGIVLLKNRAGSLPLGEAKLNGKQVAFIGPNALEGTCGGGGSASMNPQYLSHPMESFKKVAKDMNIDVAVKYALGAKGAKWLPTFSSSQWRADSSGCQDLFLQVDYFASNNLSGPILDTQFRGGSSLDLTDTAPKALQTEPVPHYSLRITSGVTPRTTGEHTFSVSSIGDAVLYINGELVIDNRGWKERGETFYAFGSVEAFGTKWMEAGREYAVRVESWVRKDGDLNQHFAAHPSIRLGFEEEMGSLEVLCQEAIALADESEFSVVVLGLTDEWESEGYDRQSMAMPGDQDYLADTLLRSVKRPENLIFVNQSGSPVELPWIEGAATFLQAFYGGQEAGNALADVLLGKVNPVGRLPITWPRKYADLPFANDPASWPGVDGKVHYKENSDVGYRWYKHNETASSPQWWFGEGESYTTFTADIGHVTATSDHWNVTLSVKNTGGFAGSFVVQLYFWPVEATQGIKLVGFERTKELKPGSSQDVVLKVKKRDAATWEDVKWVIKRGAYNLGVGTGVGDTAMNTWTLSEEGKQWMPADY